MERLVLFAKRSRRDAVKTRLARALTPDDALALHAAMLDDQIRFVRSLTGPARQGELCTDEAFEGDPLGLACTLQGAGDLGVRMERAIVRALAGGCLRVGIVGADAPSLPASYVEAAFARLIGGADAVVIPAADGGYVFVGARRPVPELFEAVPWGTGEVAAATRANAMRAGLRLAETEGWSDVDVAEDLPRLAAELEADPDRAPATRSILRHLML